MNHKSQTLYLVRHGESKSNDMNRIQGHSDSGLTQRGLRQARKVAQRLKRVPFAKMYCSDLGRAHATGLTIAKVMKKRLIKDETLREIMLGEWEGLSTKEVDEQYNQGYQQWIQSPSQMVIPKAEKVKAFHKRVRNSIDNIMLKDLKGPILVVTHGGVIASLLSNWLKADFDTVLLNLRVDNTSVTIVEKNSSRIKIHTLNDVRHLDSTDINQKNIFTNR
ncbi:MAG: broad specificity phosphatase PhoE [Candidatus Omnitrophota bacterium]|jgi:broad specificity phosphatase PhoE